MTLSIALTEMEKPSAVYNSSSPEEEAVNECAIIEERIENFASTFDSSHACDILHGDEENIFGDKQAEDVIAEASFPTDHLRRLCNDVCNKYQPESCEVATSNVDERKILFGDCGAFESSVEEALGTMAEYGDGCSNGDKIGATWHIDIDEHVCCSGVCSKFLDCPVINCSEEPSCQPVCCVGCKGSDCYGCVLGSCENIVHNYDHRYLKPNEDLCCDSCDIVRNLRKLAGKGDSCVGCSAP